MLNNPKVHFTYQVGYMCCEGNERYEAEHLCQLNVNCLTPVHQFSTFDDRV